VIVFRQFTASKTPDNFITQSFNLFYIRPGHGGVDKGFLANGNTLYRCTVREFSVTSISVFCILNPFTGFPVLSVSSKDTTVSSARQANRSIWSIV